MPARISVPRFSDGVWSPSNLTGLQAWYDASDSGSFTYTSGVLVSQWNDLSGNARHMTAQSGHEPSRTGTQNGRSIVEFAPGVGNADNGHDLDMPNAFSGLTQVTVYWVIKTRLDPPSDNNISGLMKFDTSDNAHYPFSNGVVYLGIGSNSRKTTGDPSTSLAQWNSVSVTSASSDWNMRINGSSHYSTASNTVAIGTSPRFGRTFEGGNYVKFDGYLAEMVVTNAAYDSTFETYAASKWGTP